VLLQIVAILGSRGETYTLGEAYAFGVIWSFAFKALAMLVLRYKDRSPREWRVPFNLKLDGVDLPLGLAAIAGTLFMLASVNLVTKQVATISGTGFTVVFFVLFLASERVNEKRRGAAPHVEADEFRLEAQDAVTAESLGVRPGNTLCLVRDYKTLDHLQTALKTTHTGKRDLVVLTVRVTKGPDAGYEDLDERNVFASYEQLLFSRVIALAEKAGKHVDLLVVPASNVFDAIAHTAAQLESAEVVAGRSSVMSSAEQARRLGEAWEALPHKPKHQVLFRVVSPEGTIDEYYLGAHAPHLAEEEINLIHRLWLDITHERGGEDAHHKEVVTLALERLAEDLKGKGRRDVLEQIKGLMHRRSRAEREGDEEESRKQKGVGAAR